MKILVRCLDGKIAVATMAPAIGLGRSFALGLSVQFGAIWPAIVADRKNSSKPSASISRPHRSGQARARAAGCRRSAPIGSSSMVDAMRAIDQGGRINIFLNSPAIATNAWSGKGPT